MNPIKIAFDVDGTLITKTETNEDVPRYDVIKMLMTFKTLTNCEIYVWSGSGQDYAQRWVEKLGLKEYVQEVIPKGSMYMNVAVDDEEVSLAQVNLRV